MDDDITAKIAEILNSPESMEQVKNMADMLLTSDKDKKEPETNALSSLVPDDMAGMMKIMNALKSQTGNDSTTSLLYALKPHLGEAKQKKIDTAVKLIRLYRLLPLFKEGGFF